MEKLAYLQPAIIPFLQQERLPIKVSLNEFMLNNLLSNYSIPQLAQLSGRSLSSFKREFKATFNDTPHQWVLKQKMDIAEDVLKNSELTPVMIYSLLGFRELSHFSSTFRKIKGYNITKHKQVIL